MSSHLVPFRARLREQQPLCVLMRKRLKSLPGNWAFHGMRCEIESRSDPAVALLSVEAQGQSRTMRISGEAKTMADAVAYVGRLRESPRLTAVFLSGHDEKQAGAVTVVRFSLDAKWSSRL